MDIIIGSSAVDRTEHARRVMRKIAFQESDPNYPRQARPIGVAEHLARFPHVCDDCGQTYWDQDEYGQSHLGCRGPARGSPGFS
jgi:hypothetical protein